MDNQRYEIAFTFTFDPNNIDEFDTDTLFINIYNYWCFCHYLPIYYSWEEYAKEKLRENIVKKWPTNDFCNVNLFLELVFLKNENIDPTAYLCKSEDYFEYLMTSKLKFDQMVCDRHLNISKKKRKCIR